MVLKEYTRHVCRNLAPLEHQYYKLMPEIAGAGGSGVRHDGHDAGHDDDDGRHANHHHVLGHHLTDLVRLQTRMLYLLLYGSGGLLTN